MRGDRIGPLAVVAGIALALAGCATPQAGGPGGGGSGGDGSDGDTTGVVGQILPRDVPSGWSGPAPDIDSGEPVAGWIDDEQFGVITYGSGSCYPEATAIEATGPAAVRIDFDMPPEDAICTADFAPTTHHFTLPGSVTEFPVALELVFGEDAVEVELAAP